MRSVGIGLRVSCLLGDVGVGPRPFQGRRASHSFSPWVIGNDFPGDGSSFLEVDKALISLALIRMEGDGRS
jgi:hypothetical protein